MSDDHAPLFSLEPLDDDDENEVDNDHFQNPPQQSPPPSSANTNAIPSTSELIQRFEASQSIQGGSTATLAYESATNDRFDGGRTRVVASAPKFDLVQPESLNANQSANASTTGTSSAFKPPTLHSSEKQAAAPAEVGMGSPLSLAEAKRRKDAKREEFRRLHPEAEQQGGN